MNDIHIEDFYRDMGLILMRLYSVFPRPATVYVEDIAGPDQPDEFGLHSDRFIACFSTLLWLSQEGYLRYDSTIRQEAIDQAVLSQRAFLLLSSPSSLVIQPVEEDDLPPSVLKSRYTHHAQLREALRSGASDVIHHCVINLINEFNKLT